MSLLLDCESVPSWLPDETLYSLASRYHRLSCNSIADKTSIQLFGHGRRGYQHDFPTGVAEFVLRTNGRLGDLQEIARSHTILPFYLPFRTENDVSNAHSMIAGAGVGSIKYRLGILTSRFRANHPLKACLRCLEEDREIHHVAYWHLTHQFPGVWICLKHNTALWECTVKSTGVGRFQWYLPEPSELTITHGSDTHKKTSIEDTRQFVNLALMSTALSRLPDQFHFDTQTLLEVYHRAFADRGLVTANGNIRLKLVISEYVNLMAPLRVIRELAALSGNEIEATAHIGRILRQPRSGTHPLRHLTLIMWMFGTWENFWSCYCQSEIGNEAGTNIGYANEDHGNFQQLAEKSEKIEKLLGLIRNEHDSITHAAKIVGIDVATAMVWATQAGISTMRRPKIVNQTMHQEIVRDLRHGLEKPVISKKYQISIGTVTRILRTVVGLQQARADARWTATRNQMQVQWQKVLDEHPGAGIKAMRAIASAEYAWLYRNDREWLDLQLKNVPRLIVGNYSSVKWDSRDEILSLAVREIVSVLSNEKPNSGIPLWKIIQKLPELKAKLGALDRLPLTRAAIDIATKKPRRSSSAPLF